MTGWKMQLWAAAALVAFVVIGLWMWHKWSNRPQPGPVAAQQEPGPDSPTLPSENPPSNGVPSTGQEPPGESVSPGGRLAVFTLLPGRLRGERASRFTLDRSARTVRLNIQLRFHDYSSYSVALQTSDGKGVWTGSIKVADRQGRLSVRIPANLFQSRDYIVVVDGVKDGEREQLGTYYFEVSKQ